MTVAKVDLRRRREKQRPRTIRGGDVAEEPVAGQRAKQTARRRNAQYFPQREGDRVWSVRPGVHWMRFRIACNPLDNLSYDGTAAARWW